jgi:putative heme-binding domain-containing protein
MNATKSAASLVIILLVVVVVAGGFQPTAAQNAAPQAKASAPPSTTAKPATLPRRLPWTTSHVTGTPEPPPPYRTQRLFPKLGFKNPVVLSFAPGSKRIFVGDQGGKVWSFPNDPAVEKADLVLDVKEIIKTNPGNERVKNLEALYGLTFHPDFARNRYCYVSYVVSGEGRGPDKRLTDGTRVSRFKVTDTDPPRCIPESEQIVISWLQGGHNGGCLHFGPQDGCLYISTGDGGFANPPDGLNAGQDLSHLLSKVLRIDVDHPADGLAYSIPKDNPFVNLPGTRGETWCYGLRNPWKIGFDRQTGDLWLGDVGWELWELVYRVQKGANYGWSVVEGPQQVHPERKTGPTPILPATVEIPHTDGVSVTGGYVYRGQKLPELNGTYLFGDWETRRVWGVKWDGEKATPMRDLVDPTVRLVAFCEDPAGELLLMDYDDGSIHELVRNEASGANQSFPIKLSDTGLFASVRDHRPAPGVLPFTINAEQWADHATAERFVAIPGDGTVTLRKQKQAVTGSMFQSSADWPKDSVLVKTNSLATERGKPDTRRRIETQLLHFDGRFWRGYSYRWNEAQTDATLVSATGSQDTLKISDADAPGGQRQQTWHFSSRVECARCHNQWAEYALAFNLRQLNRDHNFGGTTANQLLAFEQMGLVKLPDLNPPVSPPTPAAGPEATDRERLAKVYGPLADLHDDTASLDARARSYLHANCAHCHRTGGGGSAYVELQAEVALDATKVLDVRPTQGTFGIANARIVAASDPFRSTLYYRISKTGSGRMPHIGSEIVDERGVHLIHDWIRQLPVHSLELALIDRLKSLTDPAALVDTINELLGKVSSAILLSRAVQEGRLPASVRTRVIDMAAAHADAAVRDQFEKYLPDERRPKRLGSVVNTTALLAAPGNSERGRNLFFNVATVQCKTCHVIAGTGGKVGPDLSQIGKKYNKAQLLESVLEPSKFIDPKYITRLVETTAGKVVTGLLIEQTEKEVVLRDAKDQLIRIPANEIELLVPQRQSIMPDLQLRDLTLEQVADLLEFMAGLK